jgi:hypothetical protein
MTDQSKSTEAFRGFPVLTAGLLPFVLLALV